MKYLIILLTLISMNSVAKEKPTVTVGSKPFTESYILAEILAQTIEDAGELKVQRKLGIGATGIIYESLKSEQIDIYPEYTGTISETILHKHNAENIESLLPPNLQITEGIGFRDNYALAVRSDFAKKMNLEKISDLKKNANLRAGFSYEFMKRTDGYEALTQFYGLALTNVKSMEHALAYESLAEQKIDLIEVYSTDAKIEKYKLQVLKDDKEFFPKYEAVFFLRKNLAKDFPKTFMAIENIHITDEEMIKLNSKVELDHWNFEKTAAFYLGKASNSSHFDIPNFIKRTKEHLSLVFISLITAIIFGLPLGILAAKNKSLAQLVLVTSGLLQTIPSLALLCFLIPLFGIGYVPAIVALFLYALLPIVRNTYLGLKNIDQRLIESAHTLGLTQLERLRLIELPLASPTILAGIKLSAIINVGTATLAAFVGAGGYGAMIVTGLALNNNEIILQGAIPSAVLAILMHFLFEFGDRLLIPRGIRT